MGIHVGSFWLVLLPAAWLLGFPAGPRGAGAAVAAFWPGVFTASLAAGLAAEPASGSQARPLLTKRPALAAVARHPITLRMTERMRVFDRAWCACDGKVRRRYPGGRVSRARGRPSGCSSGWTTSATSSAGCWCWAHRRAWWRRRSLHRAGVECWSRPTIRRPACWHRRRPARGRRRGGAAVRAGRFDSSLSLMVLHWVNDLPGTLAQLRGCLRPRMVCCSPPCRAARP